MVREGRGLLEGFARAMSFDDEGTDGFSRLHGAFVFHLGVAVGLAWMTALYAALHAPWVGDIRALLDPSDGGLSESTASFLFGLPTVLALSWLAAFFGRDALRRTSLLQSRAAAFAVASAVSFAIFYLSVDRAVAAILLDGA